MLSKPKSGGQASFYESVSRMMENLESGILFKNQRG